MKSSYLLFFGLGFLVVGKPHFVQAQFTSTGFITTWKTDNPGTSGDNQITIPTGPGAFDYDIYWEEVGNTSNNGTLENQTAGVTITFPSTGTYQVEISGGFPRIYFGNTGDKDKLLTVDQWGDIVWTAMFGAFHGCSNLTITATDAPNLENVRNMDQMFHGATAFNQDIGDWDVSQVEFMIGIFEGASSFNQDISDWDVGNVLSMERAFFEASSFDQDLSDWNITSVTDDNYRDLGGMRDIFSNSGMSKMNYDNTLIGWSVQSVDPNVTFGVEGLKYCNGTDARATLVTAGWSISGDSQDCQPFITTWKTDNSGTSSNTQITIPTTGTGYDYDIYWEEVDNGSNNGTLTGQTGDATIDFGATGTFQIEISGDFPRIFFNNGGDKDKLLSVDQWGDNPWTSMEHAFNGCINVIMTATDVPNLDNVLSTSGMFDEASSFNQDISNWDVSNIEDMSQMFRLATSFNQDIGGWTTSDVNTMERMFQGAYSFNQDLSNWDVSGVGDMTWMFHNATSFDQNLGEWDILGVGDMETMLSGSNLSRTNYDSTLIGWASQDPISGPRLGADGLTYCHGADARTTLISKGWDISDDIEDCLPFVTTWTTSNGEFFIPTNSLESYNYDITWTNLTNTGIGDGSTTGATGNYIISGLENGSIYQVEISGDFPQIYFYDGSGGEKILTVEQWGDIAWTSMEFAFYGCINLTISAVDTPDLSNVTSLSNMFGYASSLNQDLSDWDVSNVTDMSYMFYEAASFNQDLGSWDISNVTNMTSMLDNCGLFTKNYDHTLEGWAAQTVQADVTLGAEGLTYCNGIDAHNELISTNSWTINGDKKECGFITTWSTDDGELTIPTNPDETYNYDITWTNLTNAGVGDGTTKGKTGNYTISGLENGSTYEVEISGDFPHIYFNNEGDKEKILTVKQWGDIEWTSMKGAFYGCSNLTIPAVDAPDLSDVTNMGFMFSSASSFNNPIGHWDVSHVTNMAQMFDEATMFNQDVSDWDVSSVVDMVGMFDNATSFNQDIGNWNTGNVTKMNGMFIGATSFNQDIGEWDVSAVTNMATMFFSATSFNQDISGWDVGNVTSMTFVFYNATAFDQDLGSWDVSSVTEMGHMFFQATSFNQDLGSWDISNVTNMGNMLFNSGLSTENYDNTLIGWGAQMVQSNVFLGANGLSYCAGSVARQSLIEDFGWTITGDVSNDDDDPVLNEAELPDLTGECSVPMPTAPTATDNCDGLIEGVPDVEFPLTESTTITWSYEDVSGNSATQEQNVIIEDLTDPELSEETLLDLTGECSVDMPSLPTATDNCAGIIEGVANVEFPLTESTTITWTYEDVSGNSTTQTQNVIIEDLTAPELDEENLVDLTGECLIEMPSLPTATDLCDGPIEGVTDIEFPITESTTITWTFEDASGNSTSQTQEAIVEDMTPPVREEETLANLTDECSVVLPTPPTASDNCDGLIEGIADVDFPLTQSTAITWTFEDESGNTATQTQQVIIEDVTAPDPDEESLADLTGECLIEMPSIPTATDNCDGLIEGVPDVEFPLSESATITWTFEDASGNSSTQVQNASISMIDNSVTQSGTTLSANADGMNYQWIDCEDDNNPIPDATSKTFSPESNGNYAVEISSEHCTVTSECFEVTVLGVLGQNDLGISFFPNPAKEFIKIDKGANRQLNIKIIDPAGREFYHKRSNDQVTQIDIARYPPGIYFISLSNHQTQVISKILKE